MSSHSPALTSNKLHQQQGGISLSEFATLHGLTHLQATKLVKAGKILGASRHPLSKHWFVFPPAVLLERPRAYKPRQPVSSDVGTSPHGLAECQAESGIECGHPASASGVQDCDPLTVDRVTPGALPDVFASRHALEAVRSVKLAASQCFYPVVLSGAQVLAIERALLHDAEAIKQKLDFVDEFEPEAREVTGEKLTTVYAALRTIRKATADKNRSHAAKQNTGVTL